MFVMFDSVVLDHQICSLNKEKIEDTKEVIGGRKQRKEKQYSYDGQQRKKEEMTNNDLQNTTQKTKDWAP